jgi:hypothetical protein
MKRLKRREFMTIGAAGAAGVVAGGCTPPKFTAVARFSGLFGLVAKPTFDDHADVLFFNPAAMPGLPNHVPVLRAHVDRVSGAPPISVDYYDPGIGIWDIKSCHVTLDPQPGAALKSAAASTTACPGNDEAQWRDPRWIASLRTVLGAGNARVNSAFVQNGNLTNTPVATRIQLKSGILGGAMPRDPRVRHKKFKMSGAPGVPSQPITDLVQLDMPDLTSLTVTIAPFDGSANRTLTITPPPGGRPVYLWLENYTDPLATPMEHHFRALYSLLVTPPATKPDPDNAEECTGGPEFDFPNYCPPGSLEP